MIAFRYASPSVLQVDPTIASEIADAFLGSPPRSGDATAHAAYAQLVHESDSLFHLLTASATSVGPKVVFSTCANPYSDADELISSVRVERVLEITTVGSTPDRLHPLMECGIGGEYDRLRAVHDLLGHAYLGLGFDRHSEYTAWRFQERFHSPLARRALATELHAEHSVRWTTGELAEHHAVLLDPCLVQRSRSAGVLAGVA